VWICSCIIDGNIQTPETIKGGIYHQLSTLCLPGVSFNTNRFSWPDLIQSICNWLDAFELSTPNHNICAGANIGPGDSLPDTAGSTAYYGYFTC
jgi:hypothetical protein